MSGRNGLASRLYRGEAGLNIVNRRKVWFSVAGALVLVAVLSFAFRGFSLGIDFRGGNEFQIPASIGTMERAETAVEDALGSLDGNDEAREVVSVQQVGNATTGSYLIRTGELTPANSQEVQDILAEEFSLPAGEISSSRVSGAWGAQVSERALLGLLVFIAVVTVYLILRFEWRMAIAAVSSLLLDLILTAGVYSLVGFEVTPSTIIGFLTIIGFALYDVVVVFDKVHENTRGITGGSSRTYAESTNLAVNQTLMRSINTSVVALLPVGGLLFIGAGLLGAGTLKDLGLVLFVGMAVAVYSSLFFAPPVLVTFKDYEPKIRAHTERVLSRRAAVARGDVSPKGAGRAAKSAKTSAAVAPAEETEVAALAGAAPKAGARPAGKRSSGGGGRAGGRPGGGNRPGGKRR
ncbi:MULTISPECIES: protein translocase subunit SecF [Polymorphospora]|uniref:Protein-export membrane protein SecF n=1 Tax=Polymorphospora lycopeni TaxID=3140240 RepID=A0ABV5D1N9_9ACTN